MLHVGDGVLVVMCSVWGPLNIASSLMGKNLNLGLIRKKNFLPVDFKVSHISSGEL